MIEKINDVISYVPATTGPMSSDIIIVHGKDSVWFYDVGCNDESFEIISNYPGKHKAILSHFHGDHTKNMPRLSFDEYYLSRECSRYYREGIVVDKALVIEDGCTMKLIPFPSTHSDGCIALEVNGEYLFVSDATYPKRRYSDGVMFYNVQHLQSQIKLLEDSPVKYVGIGHQKNFLVAKEAIIETLKGIYAKRDKSSPYIEKPNTHPKGYTVKKFGLVIMGEDDKPDFKKYIQESFQKGAEAVLGPCNDAMLPEADLDKSMNKEGSIGYIALVDGMLGGGVIVNIDEKTHRNTLEFLFVKHGMQGQGVGRQIWEALEKFYPETLVWETQVPEFDKKGLKFYENCCGFSASECTCAKDEAAKCPEDNKPYKMLKLKKAMKPQT